MGFELPNGKTARNLQDQVKFLTEKVKELIARVNELELHIEIVDELPETGSSDIIYFVPMEDPEEGNYYNEYMWIDDAWELIGTTQIDLSGYVNLTSAQTITGKKTFNASVDFTDSTNTSSTINSIKTDEYGGFVFQRAGTAAFSIGSGDVRFHSRHLLPSNSNTTYSLGSTSAPWKELYLSGNANIGELRPISGIEIGVRANLRSAGGAKNIGSSNYPFGNLYLSGNLTDGTNTVSVAAISKTRLYRHRFQFTYTGGGGYLNVITNSATAISDTESDFQTAINSAVSVYVNQSDGSRALFLSASLSQNDCRWFTSSGTATGGSVSFGQESIAEIQ